LLKTGGCKYVLADVSNTLAAVVKMDRENASE
jgi:hypothetical protein